MKTCKSALLGVLLPYVTILAIGSLWPFDFDLDCDNNAGWQKDRNGIGFTEKGQVITSGQIDYFFDKLTKGTGLTIEVWVRPYSSVQDGPARIISYSQSPYYRNFTLAQSKKDLILRLRTTQTDLNGVNPHMELPNVFDGLGSRHIVLTYNYEQECVYIDGKIRKCENELRGDFSNWDSSYPLVIGNEATGDRPWLGEIAYAAIYNRALTNKEVLENFHGGCAPEAPLETNAGLVVCYLFDEKTGSTIFNKARNISSADLHIPVELPLRRQELFQFSKEIVSDDLHPFWAVVNIVGFVPLGFLLYGYLSAFRYSNLRIALLTLTAGVFLAVAIEYLDHFLPGRHSSGVELVLKTMGASLGMIFWVFGAGRYQRCQGTQSCANKA